MISASKMSKTIVISIAILLLFLNTSVAVSKNEAINMQFDGQTMSAEFQEVPLRAILEHLSKEKGIWFKADESLLDEKISTSFKNLPLGKGLQRIFTRIDHVLFFDQSNKVRGIMILGKGSSASSRLANGGTQIEGSSPAQRVEQGKATRGPFEVSSDDLFLESPETGSGTTVTGRKDPFSPDNSTESEDPFAPKDPFAPFSREKKEGEASFLKKVPE
jgi:hypothetical protein